MNRFITLSILTLTVSGILNAGTVKVGDQIKIDIPGSTSVNVSSGGSVNVSGNGSQSKTNENKKDSEKKPTGNKTIVINGSSQYKTISMNGGNLQVTGSDNKITVKGSASSITVTGSDNNINIDSVSKVDISGSDNKIYYKTSPTKSGKPSVSTIGADNSVSKQ